MAGKQAAIHDPLDLGDAYFLSKTNPIATSDQREFETLALEWLQSEIIQRAKAQAALRWKALAGDAVPAEAWRDFEAMMQEWTNHYLILALNSDPNYPRVVNNNFGAPHEWFGLRVPGSRAQGNAENVDNNYSFAPIDGHGRFMLHGRRMSPPTGDCPIFIAGDLAMTNNIDGLALSDLEIGHDGRFVITIGPETKGSRRNHLQTSMDTRYVYMRDARVDWRQVPTIFRIERLDRPAAPPLTAQQRAAMAARFIIDDVGTGFMFRQLVAAQPINTVTAPQNSAAFGGMQTQRVARGRLKLPDDEAFVVTLSAGGAGYHSVIANNWWLTSLDYWNHTSSLSNAQSVADADGSFTYVISSRDPGVHNWIDTTGLHETLILMRWQLLRRKPDGSYGDSPWTRGRLVKLDDLDSALPAGVKRVTREEREQQLADRMAEFKLRFVDH